MSTYLILIIIAFAIALFLARPKMCWYDKQFECRCGFDCNHCGYKHYLDRRD